MFQDTQSYFTLEQLIDMIEEPYGGACKRFWSAHQERLENSPGASSNHHTWQGGYHDHIRDAMNTGVLIYNMFSIHRSLIFSLSDLLLCVFWHDAEKPWKYMEGTDGEPPVKFCTKEQRHDFRLDMAERYGIMFTEQHEKGIRYAEGVPDSEYTSGYRTMTELAAMVHMCDCWSARGWYGYPLAKGDPWYGADRLHAEVS
jgi:hypothetical protein